MPEDWLTTQEAAELSGYHVNYIRQLIKADKIEARKFGPVWQVNRASLLAHINNMGEIGARRGPLPILAVGRFVYRIIQSGDGFEQYSVNRLPWHKVFNYIRTNKRVLVHR